MTFTPPATASGDYVKMSDLNGHLCIFTAREYITSLVTSFGDTAAIKVDIIDLDTNEEHEDVLVFNKAVISSLKNNINAQVLARVGQGIAKPGKSAPWILNDATTDSVAVSKATSYLSATTGTLTQPTTAPAVNTGGLSLEALTALAGVADINDPTIAAALSQLAAKR